MFSYNRLYEVRHHQRVQSSPDQRDNRALSACNATQRHGLQDLGRRIDLYGIDTLPTKSSVNRNTLWLVEESMKLVGIQGGFGG